MTVIRSKLVLLGLLVAGLATHAKRVVNGSDASDCGEVAKVFDVTGADGEGFHGEDVLRGGNHDAQVRVVKDAPLAGIVFARDVDTGLFVEPPRRFQGRRQPLALRRGQRREA